MLFELLSITSMNVLLQNLSDRAAGQQAVEQGGAVQHRRALRADGEVPLPRAARRGLAAS